MTNQELATKLRELHAYLIICDYPEQHAARYLAIASYIEKMPEPVENLRREGRLEEIPQVGKLIKTYIKEIMLDGVSSKQRDFEATIPYSVVSMTKVPGVGPRTAKVLYELLGVTSLDELKRAEREGRLQQISGVSDRLLEAIRNA